MTPEDHLAAAVARIERDFSCVDGHAMAVDAAGTPYVVICSGGLKEEGAQTPALYSTPEHAVNAWETALRMNSNSVAGMPTMAWQCAEQRSIRLSWRVRPEIDCRELVELREGAEVISTQKWWTVYSRLSIAVLEREAE